MGKGSPQGVKYTSPRTGMTSTALDWGGKGLNSAMNKAIKEYRKYG